MAGYQLACLVGNLAFVDNTHTFPSLAKIVEGKNYTIVFSSANNI
jgi:hypothetical protein